MCLVGWECGVEGAGALCRCCVSGGVDRGRSLGGEIPQGQRRRRGRRRALRKTARTRRRRRRSKNESMDTNYVCMYVAFCFPFAPSLLACAAVRAVGRCLSFSKEPSHPTPPRRFHILKPISHHTTPGAACRILIPLHSHPQHTRTNKNAHTHTLISR